MIDPDIASMEALLVEQLPTDDGWLFEPKWDGFRCLAFRNGDAVELRAKSGKTLTRYFPEIVTMLRALEPQYFVLDGELIVPVGGILSFDALQARLHPAESRVRKLSVETPAQLMLFDCLAVGSRDVTRDAFVARRVALKRLHEAETAPELLLSPQTDDVVTAQGWLDRSGGALDGVIAKRADDPYRPGERAMLKVKQHRTADCVIGGFRFAKDTRLVGSLLLGLYDEAGLLNHVGFTSGIADADRLALTAKLTPLIGPPGFTGKAPGGPSRWSDARSAEWTPLRPELVIEVRYDQVTGQRFRHGTRLLRWRPDKAARQCRMEQLAYELSPAELSTVIGR